MKKILIIATALAATSLAFAGVAPAEAASATGYTVQRDRAVLLRAECRNYAATYVIPEKIASRRSWWVEVDVIDSRGREVGSYVRANQDGDAPTGRIAMRLCGGQPVGTYRIESVLHYSGALGSLIGGSESTDSMVDTFRVRRA